MGNVRVINSKGDVKFIPEGITKASWFIKSDWQVQDLKVEQKVIVNEKIQEDLKELFENLKDPIEEALSAVEDLSSEGTTEFNDIEIEDVVERNKKTPKNKKQNGD